MANNNHTVFQRLSGLFNRNGDAQALKQVTKYSVSSPEVLFRTGDKAEYEKELRKRKEEKLLSMQWIKAGLDKDMENNMNLSKMQVLYKDCDLMDGWPEIGAALDTYAEESCTISSKGKMISVNSSSDRIRSILEDLFENRLDTNVMLPMVCRGMCKYGNNFMLLNINSNDGVLGWKQLPTVEMIRLENGMTSQYSLPTAMANMGMANPNSTNFVWMGHNEQTPYKNWQVAHFRLLTDSFFLPYGMSVLHKARRAWKMLSMMEDMMLVYRLERSIERRVFKIFVGSIDDKDVKPYVQEIANNFKRTPIIDPETGQIDLRRNFLDVSSDYFIPVRSENAPTPIESLSSAQNITSMDDIKYMQGKVLTALRIPRTFLNFDDSQGKSTNLATTDIRFSRIIVKIQQALLMELNKIAIIHLYLLGFTDDLTNFTLSLNNPSTQIESLELDNLQKRMGVAQQALSDPGTGIPIFSLKKVLKDIFAMSDKEIVDNFNEIRLEKALAAELEKTPQIIQRTGIFDPTDKIYGELGAEYQPDQGQGGDPMGGGPMGGGPIGGGPIGGGPDFGAGLDSLDAPGAAETSPMTGNEGSVPMSSAPAADTGAKVAESTDRKGMPLINESSSLFKKYMQKIQEDENERIPMKRADIYESNFIINEEINGIISEIEKVCKDDRSSEDKKDEKEIDTGLVPDNKEQTN